MNDTERRTLDISRRGLIKDVARMAGGAALLGAGLAASPAMADTKFSQRMAQYQPKPKGAQRCDNCSQFQAPASCKVVQSPIAPTGWCQLYAAK